MKTGKRLIAGAAAGLAAAAGILAVLQMNNDNKDAEAVQIRGEDESASGFRQEKSMHAEYESENSSAADDPGEYIGQDKEVIGYYRRIGIAKADETYEEMLELREPGKRGYLVAKEDGTAYFDLDGEITEYTFDKQNFYLRDDTERNNGFSYTWIGGRLIINDGTTVTQYLRLTDEELASYLERSDEK